MSSPFSSQHKSHMVAVYLFSVLFLVFYGKTVAQNPSPSVPDAFGQEVYKQRRLALLDSLGDGVAVLYSRGTSGEMGYRADGNFWYLTGLDDPGAILILAPKEKDREVLLLAPRDPEEERWVGERVPLSESLKVALKMDRIYRTSSLDWLLVDRVKHSPVLHLISQLVGPGTDVPPDMELYGKISERIPGVTTKNSSRFLELMRMYKSHEEIAALEKAIAVTYKGMTESLPLIRPGVTEFQLAGKLQESFKQQGAQFSSFSPIVGAGEHSTILHYERLDRGIRAGELVLIDFGAEWDHYTADITRTFPADGKFTDAQARIYDVVLEAQKAAIAAIKPGITQDSVDAVARSVIRKAGYAEAFIHGTSHYIGVEVHDAGDYGQPLMPGMVITVEPGIYLPDSKIGVRIEDDILVTQNGSRVLSALIPKERVEVEKWIAHSPH